MCPTPNRPSWDLNILLRILGNALSGWSAECWEYSVRVWDWRVWRLFLPSTGTKAPATRCKRVAAPRKAMREFILSVTSLFGFAKGLGKRTQYRTRDVRT